jgi:hypothetical protein
LGNISVAFDSPTDDAILAFNTFVEIMFLMDLILSKLEEARGADFFKEYKDPRTQENVRDLKKIALRYLR